MTAAVDTLQPDAARLWADIMELATLVETDTPGWTREVFSDVYSESRQWTKRKMADAGLEVHVDGGGNIIGRVPGEVPGNLPIVTGSHTDTVHAGGRFDGILGVLGAVETVRVLQENGTKLASDLLVIDFFGEEANNFGLTCIGSRAVAGALTKEDMDRTAPDGSRMTDAYARFGLDPHQALSAGWGPQAMKAYLELHVEQGPTLERNRKQLGVVTSIAGVERLMVEFMGRADHAGTTPMDERADAVLAAAEAILSVERIACGAPVHGVATTGRIETGAGSLNVIRDSARFWAEMRSIDQVWLAGARRDLAEQIRKGAAHRGVEVDFNAFTDSDPVPTASTMQDLVASTAADLGFSWEAIPSGAVHDAAHMAELGPMGMIFVPSHNGRSHCPEEWTDQEDLAAGVHALAATLLRIDGA